MYKPVRNHNKYKFYIHLKQFLSKHSYRNNFHNHSYKCSLQLHKNYMYMYVFLL